MYQISLCSILLANMTFLAVLLVATLTIVSCQVTQMELTPAFYSTPQDAKCQDCLKAISYVLNNNVTIIKDICALILSPFRSECTKLLNEAIQGVTANKLCADVKLCPSSEAIRADPDNCKICKDIVGSLFSDSDDVKALLTEICSKAGGLADECDMAVDMIFDAISHYNATFVCQELKVCNKTSPQLLGADLCTRGPGYWCASPGNAKECGAFDFCEKKYWI